MTYFPKLSHTSPELVSTKTESEMSIPLLQIIQRRIAPIRRFLWYKADLHTPSAISWLPVPHPHNWLLSFRTGRYSGSPFRSSVAMNHNRSASCPGESSSLLYQSSPHLEQLHHVFYPSQSYLDDCWWPWKNLPTLKMFNVRICWSAACLLLSLRGFQIPNSSTGESVSVLYKAEMPIL